MVPTVLLQYQLHEQIELGALISAFTTENGHRHANMLISQSIYYGFKGSLHQFEREHTMNNIRLINIFTDNFGVNHAKHLDYTLS